MPDPEPPRPRWTERRDVPRGDDYDARWARLAAQGESVHGEADLVRALVAEHGPADGAAAILDAGCGTGRVAIELDRHGHQVVGVDVDPAMLEVARRKAPHLRWELADLAALPHEGPVAGPFDLAVFAGNVLIFVAPGTETTVVARAAARLRPGGLFVAGFQVRPGGYHPDALDDHAAEAGLELVARWSTWDRQPWSGGDYQVSVHRRRPT